MDDDVWAPDRLKVNSDAWFTTEKALNQYERADWQNVDARLQAFAGRMVRRLRKMSVPAFVAYGFRTPDEQAALYAAGRSKARFPRAAHCQGAAVDVVHGIHGWDMSRTEWKVFEAVGVDEARKLKLQLTWGGSWKFYDPAHWELSDWRDRIRPVVPVSDPVRRCPAWLARQA